MKMIRYGFIIALAVATLVGVTLLTNVAVGQPKFLVMSAKGKVEVQESGKKQWKPLKVGMELSASSVVKTSFASYVKLMMDGSRLVGVDENTQKALSEFAPRNVGEKQSKANTILAYAAKQIKQGDKASAATEFGAVRGDMEVFNATFPKYSIMTFQPEFRVVDEKRAAGYDLYVYDSEFAIVSKQTIQGNSFTYPESGPELQPNKTYYWKVTRLDDGATSDVQRFNVLHPDSVAFIENELDNIKTELTSMGADEVMHHLIRGVYFEQKQLYYNAYLEYKQTVLLAPEVQEYKDLLSNLFLSLSLHNEEYYLLEE